MAFAVGGELSGDGLGEAFGVGQRFSLVAQLGPFCGSPTALAFDDLRGEPVGAQSPQVGLAAVLLLP